MAGDVFNNADAIDNKTLPVQGASVGTLFGKAGFTYNESTNTALETFISGAPAGSLKWGIMGGASVALPQPPVMQSEMWLAVSHFNRCRFGRSGRRGRNHRQHGCPTGLASDIKALNGSTFDGFNGTTTGIIGTPASSASNINFYGTGINVFNVDPWNVVQPAAVRIVEQRQRFGEVLGFDLGNATFNGTSLTFTGNTVPLPGCGMAPRQRTARTPRHRPSSQQRCGCLIAGVLSA